MADSKEIVVDIWKSHANYLGKDSAPRETQNSVDFLARCFCPGAFYYYIIDSPTLTLETVSDSTFHLLGIEPSKFDIPALMNGVHPDDLPFMLRCEDVVAHFLQNCIAPEKIVKYKISYCMRQRTRDGSYRLFLMQTLTLKTTSDGALLKVFGTNTDISHITDTNNYKLSFIGLDGEPSFTEIDVFDEQIFDNFKPYQFSLDDMAFTKRELEVLRLIGEGLSTSAISAQLTISTQTVQTHRKHLLRKSGAKNSIDLIVTCIKKGFI